jgi:hypothetical protein
MTSTRPVSIPPLLRLSAELHLDIAANLDLHAVDPYNIAKSGLSLLNFRLKTDTFTLSLLHQTSTHPNFGRR